MLACVTFSLIDPGVHSGSGSPSTEWQLAGRTNDDEDEATDEDWDDDISGGEDESVEDDEGSGALAVAVPLLSPTGNDCEVHVEEGVEKGIMVCPTEGVVTLVEVGARTMAPKPAAKIKKNNKSAST